MKRVLITTALEKTWPTADVPVVFSGEWCKLYNRKHVWSKYDSITVPYHWDDRKKLERDYNDLQDLYEDLLGALTYKLNILHKEKNTTRHWRILIGPWLGYFIQILFDRWSILNCAIENFDLSSACTLPVKKEHLVPNDMTEFHKMYESDNWNEAVFSQLLNLQKKLKVNQLNIKNDLSVYPAVGSKEISWRSKARAAMLWINDMYCRLLPSKDRFFFISTYLPRFVEARLQMSLGQLPKFRIKPKMPDYEFRHELRNWSLADVQNDFTQFSSVVKRLIPRHIPKAYIEGYFSCSNIYKNYSWPSDPDILFTSNSFGSDDIFKAYAARRVSNGSKLIIGQHGGLYGVGELSSSEEHEFKICDKYLTWGWYSKNLKVEQAFNLKKSGKGNIPWAKKGHALLVAGLSPRYSYSLHSFPLSSQVDILIKDSFKLTSFLNEQVQKSLLIRLYPEDFGWSQKQQWLDNWPSIQLDDGKSRMKTLMKKSRLYIATYNATTFLESMGNNFPTIIFWNPNHWELREEAIPFFNALKSVGIYHESPESAAKKINEIWDNIAAWWYSADVQAVKDEFCFCYSRNIDSPVSFLKNKLSYNANEV